MNSDGTEQRIAFQSALENIGVIGRSANQEEALRETAKTLSLKTGISLEEAFYMLSNALREYQEWNNKIKATLDKLKALAQEIEESFVIDPSARRKSRERVRIIEEKYRAEIRRCERERPYRRIYKPP